MSRLQLFAVVVGMTLLGASGDALAQAERASIVGTIRESSGSVVPGVKVKVTN